VVWTPEQKKSKSNRSAPPWFYRRDLREHFHANDIENPYTEVKPFLWVRATSDVGWSIHFFGASRLFRWSDLDFEANAKDGMEWSWPIRLQKTSNLGIL